MPLEAQRGDAQGFEKETPHHAKRVRFGQDRHIAPAVKNGGELQQDDPVNDAAGGPVRVVRLAEPRHQNAVLRHAVQHAVGADDGGIHGSRQDQKPDHHHKDMEHQPQDVRPAQIHRQPADQVGDVLPADVIGDDHAGEQRHHSGADHRVTAHQVGGDAQILQLGVSNFAIHLGERFKSAHRQQRVAEGDDDRHHWNLDPKRAPEPALGVFGEHQVRRRGRGRQIAPTAFERDSKRAPDQQNGHHHRGDLHDAQRLAAGFVHALDVLPPEVNRDDHGESRGEQVHVHAMGLMQQLENFVDQRAHVLPRADHADGSGEDVIEHQRGHRQLGEHRPHAVPHNDVDSAAHVHAAAFHIHAAHREAEQHHAQHEPGSGFADGLFRRAARIERGRRQVGQDDGRPSPEADERQGDRCRDHNLGG